MSGAEAETLPMVRARCAQSAHCDTHCTPPAPRTVLALMPLHSTSHDALDTARDTAQADRPHDETRIRERDRNATGRCACPGQTACPAGCPAARPAAAGGWLLAGRPSAGSTPAMGMGGMGTAGPGRAGYAWATLQRW